MSSGRAAARDLRHGRRGGGWKEEPRRQQTARPTEAPRSKYCSLLAAPTATERYVAAYAADLLDRDPPPFMGYGAIKYAIASVTDDQEHRDQLEARILARLPFGLYGDNVPGSLRSL